MYIYNFDSHIYSPGFCYFNMPSCGLCCFLHKFIIFLFAESKRGTFGGDTGTAVPKIFQRKGDTNCPILLYKLYRTLRPASLNCPDARFYLRPAATQDSNVWYSHHPLGKNSLAKLVNTLKSESDGVERDDPTWAMYNPRFALMGQRNEEIDTQETEESQEMVDEPSSE